MAIPCLTDSMPITDLLIFLRGFGETFPAAETFPWPIESGIFQISLLRIQSFLSICHYDQSTTAVRSSPFFS